jgi:hypothetical protein
MSDGAILEWVVLFVLVLYLVVGLIVATWRFARRCRRARTRDDPDLAQFFIEALLWPAALVIDRPLY